MVVLQSNKRYVFPVEDVILLPIPSVSAEDLCQYINSVIAEQLEDRDNIKSIMVQLDEGIGQGAGCTLDCKASLCRTAHVVCGNSSRLR
ncbi:MAG: hypothetical protein DIAAKJNI_00293 [Candidatus Argoarchaeum ethanivorans]|uniref:Uncharacterized protein n=1 Tax=Candidatus Argoarchaeum ethanivorans TaxID=2608793 RepID=A0A811T5A5_9EURY|nr:MAG: hypothetical protein DIAAKJNI_00293 [Candidatus Argoarchaeum ethanivorans]